MSYFFLLRGGTQCSWCGPCKVLSPVLERLAGNLETKTGSGRPIDLLTVDTDVHGALAQKYKVRGSRTYVDKDLINEFLSFLRSFLHPFWDRSVRSRRSLPSAMASL